MTTQAWTFPVDHRNDAGFRAWGADFSAHLAAIGLVQTTDTGQIDWGTVSKPGGNTDAGYEVWRFDDTEQGSAPVYLRFRYGTDTSNTPRITCDLGDATDGAGNLTLFGGPAQSFAMYWGNVSGTVDATGISRSSFMVHTEGFLAIFWCLGVKHANLCAASIVIARTHDDSGVPDSTGLMVLYPAAGNVSSNGSNVNCSTYAVSYVAREAIQGQAQGAALIPTGRSTGTLYEGQPQVFLTYSFQPRVRPHMQVLALASADFIDWTTFDAEIVPGSGPRTYLVAGRVMGRIAYGANNATGMAVLWE